MKRRIRFHEDFRADLRWHIGWLRRERGSASIERLRRGIDEAIRLVEKFPGAGATESRRGTVVMRRLILREAPYLVWYAVDEATSKEDLWFVRLFHVRQERAKRR